MNMISTGSFLTETGASNKQSELVKKLTAAWEKKNSKTARAGGASLMALSLAACGGEDNTPFSQADVDAAKAEGVASVDITSDNTDVMLAQADYDAAIAAATTSNDADIAAAAKTEALTAANGTIYATVDAAYTAGSNVSNADAVSAALTGSDGTVYATVDAAVTAGADGVDITTDNQAAIDAEMDGTGFADVASLLAAYNDAIAATPALNVALETTQDIINGTSGDDEVTGTNLTYGASDVIVGGAGDDTLTINSTAATVNAAATVVGFETIVYNITSSDLAQADVTLTNVKSGDVTINQLANGAATTASVTDAGDITLNFGGGITGEATIGQVAASTLNVNVGTADDITITGGTSGSATVTGTASTFVEADVTMTTTGTATIVGGSGLADIDIDAKTMNVTTTNANSDITLTGMGAADVATVSIGAAAAITAANAVETVNISTGTAAGDGTQTTASVATFDTTAATTYNLTGSNDIVLAGDEAMFDGKTVTNADATGATTLRLTTVATSDLEKVAHGTTIDVAETDYADSTAATLTVKNNATVLISVDIDDTADGTDEALTIDSDTLTSGAETLNLVYNASQTDKTDGIDVSDFETVNLSTVGTPAATASLSVAKLTAGTTSAITLATGSKAITFDAMTGASFDATGYTGAITQTVGTTLTTSATYGSGADQITMTSGDTITLNGGDGVDTLLNSSTDFSTATISNFEVIQLSDAVNTFAASQLSGQALSVKGFDGTDDDIAITGAGDLDTQTINLSTLTLDANVIATDVTIAAGTIASSLSLGMNYSVTGTAVVDDIDAATVTGDVTVSSGTGADIIVTGSGDDNITAGNGIDHIAAGTGDNTINITETTAGAAADDILVGTATGVDTVTGFGSTDQILFGADDNDANNTTADIFNAGAVVLAATDAGAVADAKVVLAATDYAETDSTGTIQDNHVHIITDAAGFASVEALLDGMDTTGTAGDNESLILGFYNSTDSEFQLHYVSDTGTDAAARTDAVSAEMVAFTDIAAADIAATFANTNFGIYADLS